MSKGLRVHSVGALHSVAGTTLFHSCRVTSQNPFHTTSPHCILPNFVNTNEKTQAIKVKYTVRPLDRGAIDRRGYQMW